MPACLIFVCLLLMCNNSLGQLNITECLANKGVMFPIEETNFSSLMRNAYIHGHFPDETEKQLSALIECLNGEQDHEACCLKNGVLEKCLTVCNGTPPVKIFDKISPDEFPVCPTSSENGANKSMEEAQKTHGYNKSISKIGQMTKVGTVDSCGRTSSWTARSQEIAKFSLKRLSTYRGRLAKPANKYLRWNLMFTFLILLFVTSPVWIPLIPVVRIACMEIVLAFTVVLHLLWFVALVNNIRILFRLRKYAKHTINLQKLNRSEKVVKHLVGISFYKEPLILIIDTLNSIASQPKATLKISAYVGLEEGTPDKENKSQQLHNLFASKFERFIVTIHPKNLPGDIPGKCSNFNYSSRSAIKKLKQENVITSEMVVFVTTGDCDTVFGERYFDALEEDYWKTEKEQRNRTVWQSPLFYCINLEKSPFFVRVTGMIRSFFMMGYLIPWNINTMSVFSLTLKLFEDGEYTHPGYQMDDIIALIRWTCAVGQKCIIRVIPVATLSGPTSGSSYLNELYEWARQIRRWTIGAAEVFHYFMIKSKKLPFGVYAVWAVRFIFYYGFVLCIGSIYSTVAPILTTEMLTLVNHPTKGLFLPNETIFYWLLLGFFGLQYFWFFCVFLINSLAEPVFPNNQRDGTWFITSIFHWVMTWPTITVYCFIEMFAFLEVTVRGKEVCSHSASNKDALIKKPNIAAVVKPTTALTKMDVFVV